MKTVKNIFYTTIILALISCASKAKFPVSNAVPAAVITAKMKKDKNKNNIIEVNTDNMASPDRLNPPKKNYVVWVVTDKNEVKNIGQLTNKNAESSYLKTSIPFGVKEIFITAEDSGDLTQPAGVEISRTQFHQ